MLCWALVILCICTFSAVNGRVNENDGSWKVSDVSELKSKQFWIEDGQRYIRTKLNQKENKNKAKNVIFFIGDGMSTPTVTASRIYDGQIKGIVGERNRLFFEDFPYLGLSKTYCTDRQVADSACSATAYLSGVKANYATIGVTADVKLSDCGGERTSQNQLESIADWAQSMGKATGFVTTTRVTHASPAGTYAHTSNRDFESDKDILSLGGDSSTCIDIGRQLVENQVSRNFKVVMGGGARKLLPNGTIDNTGYVGERRDKRNLIHEWTSGKAGTTKYVYTKAHLDALNPKETDNLIGIFSNDHMDYNLDSDGTQPTLKEMTEVAVRMLQRENNGFFLFVEGGRIDHAHHETKATKALDETVQFAEAIRRAYELTNSDETLIVVSADHAHTMSINGYPFIGNKITGIGNELSDVDFLPYSTLSYANGPAFKDFFYSSKSYRASGFPSYLFGKSPDVRRVDLRKIGNFGSKDFQYPSMVPLKDETHGGDDVAVYASGPWSHMFTGVMEQNALPVLMGFAACMGPGLHSCNLYS